MTTSVDKFDFTEIATAMGESGISIGTVANDFAIFSQETGAITPFDIKLHFSYVYKRRK